ncbi:hypothetical protein MLD38_023246 [Melastoma candidum]|uniref:Uncharacterized protein n=1 Tax=Melastoma candidum TaxID=119954 RepID=A0ACB9QLX2_9MYRT|nr:hypothetical protein MLD38_023246 [Melastoma candidum]
MFMAMEASESLGRVNVLLIAFILSLITSQLTSSLTLNFTHFTNETSDIVLEGDAILADGYLDLTNATYRFSADNCVGRATYVEPIRLYDGCGFFAGFSTRFTFVVDSRNSADHADGLAFFLAPNGTRLPDFRDGSNLGLMSAEQQLNDTGGSFVAVEFDTHKNAWDPEGDHVGVDINFLKSVAYVKWKSGVMPGHKTEVWVRYDPAKNYLQVTFTELGDNGRIEIRSLDYAVNLSQAIMNEWATIGFSASTGSFHEFHKILSWEFSVTDPITAPLSEVKRVRGAVWWSSILVGAAAMAVALFVIWLVVSGQRRRGLRKTRKADDVFEFEFSWEDGKFREGARKFSYEELSLATNSFDEKRKLGQGGFGGVYKGYLKYLDRHVAVKRVSKKSKQGIKEFSSEVKIISQLQHRNLVELVGWCHDKADLLLVYEFMPNGSLDKHLFKGQICLPWESRYRIASGLAYALLYLHEGGKQCVLHRDIKSSNVMLDSDFNAKLGDFGLARLVDHSKASQTTISAGTLGYMAPECVISGKASKEMDIYSFGVVTLEITCGRKPIKQDDKDGHGQAHIVMYVWEQYRLGSILEAADKRLSGKYSRDEMERLMKVGLWCTHPHSSLRPSIRQAISVLNAEAPLPSLPPDMPILQYTTPSFDITAMSLISPFSPENSPLAAEASTRAA